VFTSELMDAHWDTLKEGTIADLVRRVELSAAAEAASAKVA